MKSYSSYDDEDLMNELKADNMFAFDVLYKRYSRKLYKFAYSILKSPEDSENIVQDVFLRLFENRNKVKKGSSVKCYIFSIAHNSAISQIRKKAKESHFFEYLISIQDFSQSPVDIQIAYNELTDKLNIIVSKLPDRQREIFILHRDLGYKYKEISKKMKISVNTVENQMSRALKTIRIKMGITL